MTDAEIVLAIIEREGGYVNNPADKGGPTKYGITLETLGLWRKQVVTAADVEALTKNEAFEIYQHQYIVGPLFHLIVDDWLRGLVVDCGVLHGPRNATKMLQRALKVKDDGVIGPITVTALNLLEGPALRRIKAGMVAERAEFIGRIVTDNLTDADKDGIPDNAEFAKGWIAHRVAPFIRELA